jgi:hypothetical protein
VKQRTHPVLYRIVLPLVTALLAAAPARGDDDGDLLTLMSTLQTLSHKLQLSLDAENVPLAAFYAHELEETAEAIEAVETYDGHPVGALTRGMLTPQIEAVNRVLDDQAAERLAQAHRVFDAMIEQCNACHVATGHGFIVIARNPANPYAQSFAPASAPPPAAPR